MNGAAEVMKDSRDAEKRALRQEMRERARQLDRAYLEAANMEILTRFLSYPVFQQVDSLFCYVNMDTEPDTRTIIECAWQMGKTVAVPKCVAGASARMVAVEIHAWEELIPGRLGILEPREGLPEIDGYKLELAVIPCLSADPSGGRLGHGAGYYDRFLQGLGIYKYCLCFDKMLSEQVPMDAHDIRMDRVFTESQIYNPHISERLQGSRTASPGILQRIFNLKPRRRSM